jgi:hypothetical protein
VTAKFVPNTALIETRFLVVGDVFECNDGRRCRVTGESFTLLGTTLLPVEVTVRSFGRTRVYGDNLTVWPRDRVLVVGRYC